MRKILSVAILAGLALSAVAPMAAHADDDNSVQVGKDTYLSTGMKFWVNTWQTNLTGNGVNWTQLTEGPHLGYVPNVGLKYKQMLMSASYMGAGNYTFPTETFFTTGAGSKLDTLNITGNRQEFDYNIGYYVIPQLALTVGYKGINEKFTVNSQLAGAAAVTTTNSVYLNGFTLGVVGSAPIGHNLSVYGSGVGGWMAVTYTPSELYLDTAQYEASELGIAWRPGAGFSTTLGYKFQLIQTSINPSNSTNYQNLPRNEVTRGFMLGASYVF